MTAQVMPSAAWADPDRPVFDAASALGSALGRLGWSVVTAESCTGGLVARALTEAAGSSAWFERGFVTYSNEAKVESLGVAPAVLAAHGAVSEPVAREMALGALAHGRGRIALSITGIAGPSGGSDAKPVGTVCFGWATRERIEVGTVRFEGDRAAVRRQAALHALRHAHTLLPRDGEIVV